jgi:hypothetical protein
MIQTRASPFDQLCASFLSQCKDRRRELVRMDLCHLDMRPSIEVYTSSVVPSSLTPCTFTEGLSSQLRSGRTNPSWLPFAELFASTVYTASFRYSHFSSPLWWAASLACSANDSRAKETVGPRCQFKDSRPPASSQSVFPTEHEAAPFQRLQTQAKRPPIPRAYEFPTKMQGDGLYNRQCTTLFKDVSNIQIT